jgi:Amt family ammonium transporter
MEATAELSYALNTFYFLVCGALVMWMAAGFAMLEAGLVRSKNTTEILTKNIVLFAVACTMFMLVGYEIMYPDLSNYALTGITEENLENGYAPSADFFFQVVFVATAMSIVSGAVAERMKLLAFLIFAVVMTGFIYPMEGNWTWGGEKVFGLYSLGDNGFSDFAGSGIVHMAGAAAGVAGVLVIGARKGKYTADGKVNAIPGANMPLATLGTFILWMGWFMNTNAAAAGGCIAALTVAKVMFGKFDLTMALNGCLAGLVAITAEPSTPTALQATLFGAAGGVLVVLSIVGLDKLKFDDPVGAVSVHGVVGLLGLLLVPLTNDASSFSGQLLGAFTIFTWVFVTSFVAFKVIGFITPVRVTEEEEYEGSDLAECGLEAYPEFTSAR